MLSENAAEILRAVKAGQGGRLRDPLVPVPQIFLGLCYPEHCYVLGTADAQTLDK